MPEITCATCGMQINPSESTGQGFNGHMHLHVDRCVELLREENAELKAQMEGELWNLSQQNAALQEDKARLDWLERELIDEVFPIIWIEYNEYGVERISFTYRDADSSCSVTDPTIRGAIDKAFARLDATRKGGKG